MVYPKSLIRLGLNKKFWLKFLKEKEQQGDSIDLVLYAISVKILFPEEFNKVFKPKAEMWEKLGDEIDDSWREGRLSSYLDLMTMTQMLSAEEIKATEEKIEIIMPKKKFLNVVQETPLPQIKKF